MKNKLLFFLIYQSIFLAWCFKLHRHFFEFTQADKVGLMITSLMPLILFRFNLKQGARLLWIISVLLPISILPLIKYSLHFFSEAWIFLYLFLFSGGCTLLISSQRATFFLGLISVSMVWFLPYSFQKNQTKYYDSLSKTISTRYGEVDIVDWKGDQWIYYNNSLIFSTVDGHMHTETLVHTSVPLIENPSVLLVGDDFGLTKKEVNKYSCNLTHVPYDVEMLKATGEFNDQVIHSEIIHYLESANLFFDVIIVDLPDPEHLAFRFFYQEFFYQKCIERLTQNGILITNAGGYYTDEKYYQVIASILQSKNLKTELLQALIPTLGHRVWIIASSKRINLEALPFNVATTWINPHAIQLMLAKGKETYPF